MKKMSLFRFRDFDASDLVKHYVELYQEPRYEDIPNEKLTCFGMPDVVLKRIKVPKPSKVVLYHKFLFLVDLIVSTCVANRNHTCRLPASHLDDVLGSAYVWMLYTLSDFKLIEVTSFYRVSESCRKITLLNWRLVKEETTNLKVKQYFQKWFALKKKDFEAYAHQKENLEVSTFLKANGDLEVVSQKSKTEELDTLFFKKYNEALRTLRFRSCKQDVLNWIDASVKDHDTARYHYRRRIIETFDPRKLAVRNVDRQGRIYSFLTSLPKELKPFFNIKYQLDVANMHPLLLCHYLIAQYKINEEFLLKIDEAIRSEYFRNEEREPLHVVLNRIIDGLDPNETGVPTDVLKYIHMCSCGILWDDLALETGYPRDEIKGMVFRDIFYADRDYAKYTELGQRFIDFFPNVYKTIRDLKNFYCRKNKGILAGRKDGLALYMMRLESTIMRAILSRCFDKGLQVVNIHDAIIVLDQENLPCPEEICDIMRHEFARYYLHPTIHVDNFG